ncbi:MAG: hypothetical protein KAJ12_10600, partial [Bacteroidetes bacterium]|nr:hypothetical protein [Bacteroidota bacterium]
AKEVIENAGRFFLFNTGRVALMKNELQEAREFAAEYQNKAEAADNTFQIWLAHQLNGRIAMKEEDYARAVEEFNQANLQNPYNLYRLALAHEADGQGDMARESLEKAVHHNTLNSMQYAFVRHRAKEKLDQVM